MDLKVMIVNGHFVSPGNYFIIAQLDEMLFPQKERKTQKQRTEILTQTTNPKFKKNMFNFNELSYGSRLTLKFGVFMTKLISDPNNNSDLLKSSRMIGSAALTLTNKLITLLRQEKRIEQDLQILQTDGTKELGRLAVCLKYKSTDFDAQISDDIHLIENIYYDVFETDMDTVKMKMDQVEKKLLDKQKELQKEMKKLYFMRNAHKSVAYDLGNLRKARESLETGNEIFRDKIKAANDVNEIHIHIDLLKQTDQGVDVLRQKFAHLTNKLTFERSVYNELSEHYFHIEQQIQRTKDIQKQVDEVKQAGEQQQFHLKRAEDLLPHVEYQKNTIASQESIIKNLQSTIQTHLKNQDRVTSKDLQVRVEQLKHEKQLLEQKNIQIQEIFKIGKGDINYNEFNKIKNDDMLREDPEEILYFRKKNEKLMNQIEELTSEMEGLNAQDDMKRSQLSQKNFDVHMDNYDRNQIIFEIENKENQARSLQEELIISSRQFAHDLADLKIKRNLLDNLIEANQNVNVMHFN